MKVLMVTTLQTVRGTDGHRSRSSRLYSTSWRWGCVSEGKEERPCLDIQAVGANKPKLGEGSQHWVLPFFQI